MSSDAPDPTHAAAPVTAQRVPTPTAGSSPTPVASVGTPTEVAPLDLAVAQRLGVLLGVDDPTQRAALALATAAPRAGHVCVDLATVTADVVTPDGSLLLPGGPPPVGAWVAALLAGPLARSADGGDPDGSTPLVVDGTRCYLDRYWAHEEALRLQVLARSDVPPPGADAAAAVRAVLDVVTPRDPGPAQPRTSGGPVTDRQRLAVATALLRPLTVLSGGPGTGKTHTVVSILAAHVLHAARVGAPAPRLAIAAPTGKAAARLVEAIRDALDRRDLPGEVDAALRVLEGRTLHRLLGYQWHAPTRFVHDARNPLPYDVVVVDEASMVALGMTRRLVEAVATDARLVLVGDRDQLTSVEAGAVLGDLCGPPAGGGSSLRLSPAWSEVLTAATGEQVARDAEAMPRPGPWDGVVQLERGHRFGDDSGIGAVSRAIRDTTDDADPVLAHLRGDAQPSLLDAPADVVLVGPTAGGLPVSVRTTVLAAARRYLAAADAGDAPGALQALDDVRLLCATRSGPLGVDATNLAVESWLAHEDPERGVGQGGSYVGRPVLVTRNDPDLALMNGDVGVTLEQDGRRVVVFPDATRPDGFRAVAAVRLPPHETVWAMTIHKAQGSQFRHAVVVLPDRDSRVLSRELVYTGVTRASERLTVVADEQVLRAAVLRPVRRATGLRERLWPRTD